MDSDDEDDFVSVGNPLAPYDEGEVPKKPTPFQEQEVRDAKGRAQRFHGAFTGGFSAGFFNSVGSKEGWTPSTFKSSRVDRSGDAQQRPEDFMDAEDLSEHGIAPRKVATTDMFAAVGREGKRRHGDMGDTGDTVLLDLVRPIKMSMGMRLLGKMGWRPGQGIGPRQLKHKKKHKQKPHQASEKKVYGCALPPSGSESEESEDEYAVGQSFAPKDVTPISFTSKNDMHGLGYHGIDPSSALSSTHSSLLNEGITSQVTAGRGAGRRDNKKGIRGNAFGVGALQEDDDDIYGLDSMDKYDSAIGGPVGDGLHGWTAPGRKTATKKGSRFSDAPVTFVSKVLEGFRLSNDKCQPKKVYPPPQLPRNFRPVHIVPLNFGSRARADVQEGNVKSASERSAALGEKADIKSIFELVSDKDKEKIDRVHIKPFSMKLPSSASTQQLATSAWSQQDTSADTSTVPQSAVKPATATASGFPATDPPSYQAATAGPSSVGNLQKEDVALFQSSPGTFKPFARDPAKQQRYEAFVELQQHGNKDDAFARVHSGLTEWEREREREEFSRAAALYRPMTSLMASRFTTAQHDDHEPIEAKKSEASDQDKAVEMKMFGKLTRDTQEWHPDKRLCKHFNVPNPYPDSTIVGVPKARKEKYSLCNLLSVIPASEPLTSPASQPLALPAPQSQEQKKPPRPLEALGEQLEAKCATSLQSDMAEETAQPASTTDTQHTENEEEKRPPMDLFKAIFADSDSEIESEEEDLREEVAKIEPMELEKTKTGDQEERDVINGAREGTSQESNMDALNKTEGRAAEEKTSECNEDKLPSSPALLAEHQEMAQKHNLQLALRGEPPAPLVSESDITEPHMYGPAPPPPDTGDLAGTTAKSVGDTDSCRKHKHRHKDKHKRSKKKKKKDKDKKKKHKKKHSKKSKKAKTSRAESSASSGDDGDYSSSDTSAYDSDVPSTADLLRRLKEIPKSKRHRSPDNT